MAAEVATETDQDYYDRARSTIMRTYSPTVFALIEQWATSHHFKIRARMSEHVISLTQHTDSIPSDPHKAKELDDHAAPRTSSSVRSAEHIFNVAMGLEAADDDPKEEPKSRQRCDICRELVSRGKMPSARCVHQQLLLCPDCIIARCSDSLMNEHVHNYLVIHYLPADIPATHNLVGKWSFEFLHRMKIDLATFEGFIAFRTFITYNAAYICPPVARPGSAGPAAPKESGGVFQLMRKATKDRTQIGQSAQAQDTNSSYYIIRSRSRDGIMFQPARNLMDACLAVSPPIVYDERTIKELETCARNIFNIEQRLVYRGASFRPQTYARALAPASAPASDEDVMFNYWRGWHLMAATPQVNIGLLPPAGCSSSGQNTLGAFEMILAPIISYVSDIWCGGVSNSVTLRNASVAMKDSGAIQFNQRLNSGAISDKAHFILSWFAHIIQAPDRVPECQLVFRGFVAELVQPLLQFLGRAVIGSQYFIEMPTVSQSIVAGIREDCLLMVANSCVMKDFKPVMRELRALWRLPAAHKLTPAEKLAKQRHMPLECEQKIIDTEKIAHASADAIAFNVSQSPRIPQEIHKLMRAAICLPPPAQQVPVEQARRRFCVIDYSPTEDATVDSRLRALQEAIANPETAHAMFLYLAQLSPLVLHWT